MDGRRPARAGAQNPAYRPTHPPPTSLTCTETQAVRLWGTFPDTLTGFIRCQGRAKGASLTLIFHGKTGHLSGGRGALVGADDLEVLVDEDVVRPVDADVVDLIFAVAQFHNTVDDAAWVGGQRSFRRLIRLRSADDRPRSLRVVRRDLTDLLCRRRC